MNKIEDSHFHPDSVGKSHVPIQHLKCTKSRGSAVKGKLSMFSFFLNLQSFSSFTTNFQQALMLWLLKTLKEV